MHEWFVIGLMGLVTFTTRVAGVQVAKWLPRTPFWTRFVQHLPASLLVAIATPSLTQADPALLGAAWLTLAIAATGVHFVLAMSVGLGAVALSRAMGW